MKWNPVKDKCKYGIVVNNFHHDGDFTIQLEVGNTVHIFEEAVDWYFGYVIPNRAVQGIFPKSFIHIKESIVDRTGQYETVVPRTPPIIQELTGVLREWGLMIKDLYISRHPEFERVYSTMNNLISERKKMLSGQLLVDEMKQIKYHITDNIDLVNRLLGLDMVVRDEQGNILNPDITSTIKLFRHHLKAAEKLNKHEESKGSVLSNSGISHPKPHLNWTIKLNITNLILKVPDPCEISLAFYTWESNENRDGREKLLTEPYIFTWTPKGYDKNTELYSNLVCLYTDLSNKIILQDKPIFLVGSVVREGAMTHKESDRRSSTISPKKIISTESIRRPFGLFIKEISGRENKEVAILKSILESESAEICVPFYPCSEKDSFESMLRKFVTSRSDFVKDFTTNFNLAVWVTLSLLNGGIKQLRKENPHYMPFLKLPISAPLGMSDAVVPGDVRNDLYVTLAGGDFSRDRNVEASVVVCNEKGEIIPGVIRCGCGKPPIDEYRSVTYYHESKPRWMETFKVALPIEEFRKAHLRFLFKHRNSNEAKDKNEKPFALCFVNLIQPNGTTLLNTDHELLVYKIDNKKLCEDDASYLKLACVKQGNEEICKKKEECYNLSSKDSFSISTVFCSTKLTQKAELLSLLEWGGSGSSSKQDLKKHLSDLRNVPSEELIIFLQDTLDVLFEILMNSSKDVESDNLVFESLVDVIYMAAELNKHDAYQSVLDTYIEQNFHATLAYNKLIAILQNYIEDVCTSQHLTKTGPLNKAMKCLHYMIKFIIKSRKLFYELHAQGQQTFQDSLEDLLKSIAKLMSCSMDSLLPVQGLCLKYLATTIPDIMSEFDHVKLSHLLIRVVSNLQDQRLSPQRLTAMCEIAHSSLFVQPLGRGILLEAFVTHIKKLFMESEEVTDSVVAMRKERTKGKLKLLLGDDNAPTSQDTETIKTEKLNLSVKILCDILDILYSSEVGPTVNNLMLILEELLQEILSIVSKMRRDDEMLLQFVALFVSLIRQIPENKLLSYLENYNRADLVHLLSDILMVIKDLIENPVFPHDWSEMIFLENFVLMKLLHIISKVIMEKMAEPFVDIIWNNFFQCAVRFITQPSLQLEKFTPSKRNKMLSRYKDQRREVARTVKQLWMSLGQHKIRFIVRGGNGFSLVEPFLELTMLPEVEVRKSTIPIFFDMMQSEFYSKKDREPNQSPTIARKQERIKGKFDEFEREMLEHLDHLVEGGSGDGHYREVFIQIMSNMCKNHSVMANQGLHLVKIIGTLMEKLLQYRTIMNAPDHSPEIRMSCTVSLLDFYADINRKELYLRYLYKLFDLHRECDNFTEAGYTLKLHANLLSWKHTPLPIPLKCARYSHLNFNDQLKEKLYYDIILNFKKGKMWEAALKISKELVERYEEVTLEYDKLSKLLHEMSQFYENIMNPDIIRPEPEYFRVAYYGRGFPAFLQNKVFIYRGNGFELISEFQRRILDPFPNAEIMKTLSPPSQQDMESAQQYIQINKVDCVADSSKFTSTAVAQRIRLYYQVNLVDTFTYLRPFHRGQKDRDNEFATLWVEKTLLKTNYKLPGLLRCFLVIEETKTELTPLDNAINQLKTTNLEIENLIRNHARYSNANLEPLTRKVNGVVDPAVMGGNKNYEKAFFTSDYEENHPEDAEKLAELKNLISKQTPLLELALEVHGIRVGIEMQALHIHMIEKFGEMKISNHQNYGVSPRPLDLEAEVMNMRRQTTNHDSSSGSARSSHYSMGDPSSFSPGISLSRISLGVNRGGNATLPRGMRLTSTSTPISVKDKKAFKYLRGRRDSFAKKEGSTKWFAANSTEDSSPSASPMEVRQKANLHRSMTENRRSSRPNSLNASIKSTSSNTSLDRLSFDNDLTSPEPIYQSSIEPISPSIDMDSPPPLPAKNRNLDPDRSTGSPSLLNNVMNSVDNLSFDEAPEKPPRPDLMNKLNGNL